MPRGDHDGRAEVPAAVRATRLSIPMHDYYAEKLSAERLRACYEVAPPRVQAYLEGEIEFVLARTTPSTFALDLGCGYGRVLRRVAAKARASAGIDTSLASLAAARGFVGPGPAVHLLAMDASRMGFCDGVFDLTFCVQNGICAFGADETRLFGEALRVTRPGGRVLFSSYAAAFWDDRLEWFELQAARGLIGPIDRRATGDGVIVCTDGLRLAAMAPEGFAALAGRFGLVPEITEVAGASLFCEVVVPERSGRSSPPP